LRSPDPYGVRGAALRPLLAKEFREVVGGRALWTMLLLVCPLVGYSFLQAVSLYGEASAGALQSPVVAASLSPLDGILVPTFGAFYVAVTLLFPFVAIRVLAQEKETGALRLLVQLPYRSSTLISTKLAAVLAAWILTSAPALSALVIWMTFGGHLSLPETSNLIFGHLLYGLLVGAIALFSASVSDNAATAAIMALAFTIGSWVLDFTVAGHPGVLAWIAGLSLTQTLRPFEQGLFSAGLVVGMAAVIGGFATLAGVWLPPGVPVRNKVIGSIACVLATAVAVGLASQIRLSADVSEDQRNSFSAADQRLLAQLTEPLIATVHLAPEDPRYADLRRNVLSKLERAMPNVTVRLASSGQSLSSSATDEAYGQVEYRYGGRPETSRSTSPREILPLLYNLAGVQSPAPLPGGDYPGYPLVTDGYVSLAWFFGALPLLVILGWWWSRRPPRSTKLIKEVCHEHE
jgi:ABC-2 type transport system permease protein